MAAMEEDNLSDVSDDEAPPKDGPEEEMKVAEHRKETEGGREEEGNRNWPPERGAKRRGCETMNARSKYCGYVSCSEKRKRTLPPKMKPYKNIGIGQESENYGEDCFY